MYYFLKEEHGMANDEFDLDIQLSREEMRGNSTPEFFSNTPSCRVSCNTCDTCFTGCGTCPTCSTCQSDCQNTCQNTCGGTGHPCRC